MTEYGVILTDPALENTGLLLSTKPWLNGDSWVLVNCHDSCGGMVPGWIVLGTD